MTIDELRQEAEKLVEASRWKRIEVAEKLGISAGTVSSALNKGDSTYASTLIKIIELFTEYTIERETVYVAKRKEDEGAREVSHG
ncbi:MAG: hypothetical protein SH809_02550 [Rhodothermales bacterium]|nr:hypothetical protein [Rhodothermales bacterium]